MSTIRMSTSFPCYVNLPSQFVDKHMTKCPPMYALIYIYGLRRAQGGLTGVSMQEIGAFFLILETDVLNAWKYWEKEGLVRIDNDMAIEFLPLDFVEAEAPVLVENEEPVSETPAEPLVFFPLESKSTPTPERPQYTPEELAHYRKGEAMVERLFACGERAFGKTLNYNDMNSLFGFYDWMGMPIDVIEYLLDFCAENGHRYIRYIEKAAADWHDRGINTLEKAKAYTQRFDKGYREILNLLGANASYPTPAQRKTIDRWQLEWKFSTQLILLACDISSEVLGKPKLTYLDSILKRWHESGIATPEAAEADRAVFKKEQDEKRKVEKRTPKSKAAPRYTFEQREYNKDVEKLEREYRAKLRKELSS